MREDQIVQIHRLPDGSPVITNDEDRSSTIAVGGNGSGWLLLLLLSNPRVAMLTGGKSPLFLFSLNFSICSGDRLVGRMLQLERRGTLASRDISMGFGLLGVYSLRECDTSRPHR